MRTYREYRFETRGCFCTFVWVLRFYGNSLGYRVTCNGAGDIFCQHASRSKAKRLLHRFLNWNCFRDAAIEARIMSGNA